MGKSLNKVIYNWLIFILLLVSAIFGGTSFINLLSQSDNVIKTFVAIFIFIFSVVSLLMFIRSLTLTFNYFKGDE